jgi:hypothetical protein
MLRRNFTPNAPPLAVRVCLAVARAATVGMVAASLVLGSGVASAAEVCSLSTERWIAVRAHGAGLGRPLADSVLADLKAELRRQGLDACPAESLGLPPPIATMDIEASQPGAVHLSLDFANPASGKGLSRDLQLDSMPADGHSLAVAVAADELVASSRLVLSSRPLPQAEANARPTPPQAESRRSLPNELALLGATERFDGRTWSQGLDLTLRRWLLPRLAIEAAVGWRALVEEAAPHGRLRSRALPVSVRILGGLVPFAARTRAGAAAAVTATTLFCSAEPDPGATSSSQTALAVYLRGELWADVALGTFRVRASAGAGAPLRSVTVDDSHVGVSGARGLELHAQAGFVIEL